jgi:peptidoglycan/LPS O-acetylase OafA/YrhL
MQRSIIKNKADNSFDEMRLILAFVVMLSHIATLTSNLKISFLSDYFDTEFAVKGFFAISGYLVTNSYLRTKNLALYAKKRFLRIYPAYCGVLIYCIIIGVCINGASFSEFMLKLETFYYIVANMFFLNFLQSDLPGVFLNNNFQALNGSLWTLKVEVMFYCFVPILCMLQMKYGTFPVCGALCLIGVVWFYYFTEVYNGRMGYSLSQQFPGQLPYFVLGSLLGSLQYTKVFLKIVIIIFFIYYFLIRYYIPNPQREILHMLFVPLVAISLAKSSLFNLGIGRYGDFSYGVYLYHFPTIQLLEHFQFYDNYPYESVCLTIIITMCLSILSWYIIERCFIARGTNKSGEKNV